MVDQHTPAWGERRVSSYSDGANNCVEVAWDGRGQLVGVWDSKAVPTAAGIEVTRATWRQFASMVKPH